MKTVLVIEDLAEVRELIAETLSLSGYEILLAEDGLTGVQVAQERLPDLILCDVNMPGLDGYGTLTSLRQNSNTASIPFIFLTGISDKMNMRLGMELGADDYITKPFTVSELTAAVRTRLEKTAVLARQAEKKLEELRGNISLALPHELLTPLTGILGFSSVLIEEHQSLGAGEIQEFARNIHLSALRLQRLVENFLLYAQLQVFDTGPDLYPMRLKESASIQDSVVEFAHAAARRAGREEDLALEVEDVCLPISTDKLHKILFELLDNAFKFSPPGSRVTVGAGQTGDSVLLTITDRGRGMAPNQIMNVGAHMQFERRFYEQQGAGLGLIIARRLVELHGGALSIESVANRETVVRLAFSNVPIPEALQKETVSA